ncbi:traB domain-containing protein isoform X1 [Arabidopsis lyrata subsp. lyrata]|uniref:traB domain-containing protein isoform X1 n=1 Tax=Arabidopsis lyrata subsp. lyrata TaxID=81972 RepID=UPI000A29D753|nr:traB domain-containing protein isoform X1 [Arabidopsis lyrata subsp. lyrata]|eukprot:XP_020867376.1 traB domain-containing protein isoform X1 [Arabidopsis lyrata subsp. lyrata]
MKLLSNPPLTFFFPFSTPLTSKPFFRPIKVSVSVQTPPPDFDFRNEIASDSRAAIAKTFPELLDLADNGTLILVQKQSFGPVPAWRKEFVEPEAIWLVGTSHISPESASVVERVVRTVKPDNVAVELCRSRAGIMYTSSVGGEVDQNLKSGVLSLTGTGFLGAVGRSLDLGGQTALALRLLLAVFSSKLSSVADRPFGDEFRAARKASEEVGAQLVLGDRPIEITLQRAWNSLKWGEKFNLVMAVTRAITSSSGISAAELKEQETDESNGSLQLYERLSFSYPSLLLPLIHERDTYLAWSLKRSKAVNGCKTVVGVIGKGHMNGVIYALVSDSGDLRFKDLVGRRDSSDGSTTSNGWIQKVLKSLARDTIIGFLLWELYEEYLKFMMMNQNLS